VTSPSSLDPARPDTSDGPVARAAARLITAGGDRAPCAPVRDEIGAADVEAAYAVQQILHRRALDAGREVSGRKIGLTAPAVQAQLGVDQPDFGFLYADMDVTRDANSGGVDPARLLQPKIEAEVAFLLGADLDTPGPSGRFDDAAVAEAIAAVVPALEIVDSRVAGWDISFADTVADNASAGLYVLGEAHVGPAVLGPDLAATLARVSMTMTRSHENEAAQQVSTGRGADCLGSPVTALAWLATTARRHGEPLRVGQVVLAGALGPMVPVAAGDTFTAALSGLGGVTARFAPTSHPQQGSTR
jgi:2-keto-4-pentenoate hydratase